MPISLKQIRDRAWQFLSPQAAAAAGMSLAELQQFIAGNFHPNSDQLAQLAKAMRIT